jgi:putative ABC transport system permease protein
MIKTWLLDALRNIKKRIISWLSIATIVFIGTTLILGLYFGSSTVTTASTSYVDGQNFRDFDVSCSIGIQADEVDQLKEIDQINDAEGQISVPAVATLKGTSEGITVVSATERISVPTVTEGTMPSADDECAMSLSALNKLGASIGDEIEVNISSARFAGILPGTTYKITGVASHPDYMVNISTDYIVVPLSCFDTSEISFDFSNVLLDADIDGEVFARAYQKKSAQLKEILQKETDSIAAIKVDKMSDDLDAEYENARKKAQEQLDEGKLELDEAKKLFDETLKTATEKLGLGEEELNNLKSTVEKELSEAKRKIAEGEEEYNTSIAEALSKIENGEKDLEKELENARFQLFAAFLEIDKGEKTLKEKEEEYQEGLEKYNEGLRQFEEVQKQAESKLRPEILVLLSIFYRETGNDYLADELGNAANGSAAERARAILDVIDSDETSQLREILMEAGLDIEDTRSKLERFVEADHQLETAKGELEEARRLLDQGWYTLEQAKRQLADGEAEYDRREAEARQQLEDAKKEFEEKKAEGARQLEDAKKTLSAKQKEATQAIESAQEQFLAAKEEYDTQKEEGEKQIGDATKQYEDAKKEADDKLGEIKEQIDAAKNTPCSYMIRTRDVNFPFVQTKSFIKAIAGFFDVFTPLYAGIIAIVCFFTMTIIIEEQTSQIGTCKAFGMYESEIMRKYIIFGASASLFGALSGIVGAFAIEKLLINTMKDNLSFSLDNTGHNVVMLIILPVVEVLITVIAVLWSCHRYIRCSAVGLINGSEPAGRYRKKSRKSSSGRLYTHLIINNLLTDIGREAVSVVTVVLCVFLVGFGIDIKLAYEGALERQMYEIWQYDLTLTESDKITDDQRSAIRQALADYDSLYLPVTAGVIGIGESQIMTSIICVDDKEEFAGFYTLKDDAGKTVSIPDDRALVTEEMKDKNKLMPGTEVTLVSRDLNYSKAVIGGTFMLYAGKTMIMTNGFYENSFGHAPVSNTYYIKAPAGDAKALRESLADLPGVSQVELSRNLRDRNMAVVNIYNAVVVIVIVFSVILSFMILLNLSNILVAHRMKELLTMRVNGFSNANVIGYLVREVLATEVLSVGIALALGLTLSGKIIASVETDAFMFVREPYALAWTASVIINILFAVTINFIAFRNVNKVPLTDINKY